MHLEPWLSEAEKLSNILQNIAVVMATICGAWWAYATFGHKEKTDELVAIARKVSEINSFIDRCISKYKWNKLLEDSLRTTAPDNADDFAGKYRRKIGQQEIELDILLDELENLQHLSFRVPIAFRLLDLAPHLIDLRLNKINKLVADEDKVQAIRKNNFALLHKIEIEVNAHRKFLNFIRIKSSNIVFFFKKVFKGMRA